MVELRINEIGPRSFYGPVDDWKGSNLTMKLDGLAEIVMRAVRDSRLS